MKEAGFCFNRTFMELKFARTRENAEGSQF